MVEAMGLCGIVAAPLFDGHVAGKLRYMIQ